MTLSFPVAMLTEEAGSCPPSSHTTVDAVSERGKMLTT
jgi:hypothetical protein